MAEYKMKKIEKQKKNISLVIPVYNEEKSILHFHKHILNILCKITKYNFFITYVNDGSSDHTLEHLLEIKKKSKIKIIDFSRNFGKESALTAGLELEKASDAIITLDSDLQHPIELIPKLLEKWEEGFEMVVGVKKSISNQEFYKVFFSKIFYYFFKKISYISTVPHSTDFRLFDKKITNAYLQTTEKDRLFRGIMDWLGFKRAYITFDMPARNFGSSSYSFKKLIQLATNSITSFSLLPLKVTGYLGVIITFISGMLLLFMIFNYFFLKKFIFSALAIVLVTNTFLIGILLCSIGLVALYIGKINNQVTNRPLYIIRDVFK